MAKSEAVPEWRLANVGFDFRHDAAFVIDRPHGSGDYLFLHFTTSIRLRDVTGEHVHPAGSCILFTPGFPQWYCGEQRGFANDWCHFAGRGVEQFVEESALPVNRIVRPVQIQPLPPLIHALQREHLRREPLWQNACAGLLMQLLVAFARGVTTFAEAEGTTRLGELAAPFHDLRSRAHHQLTRRWTLAEMARTVHLSPSRFAHLYRQYFGISPIEDLIAARIERARWLLSSGTVAVKQAAVESGFSDIHYFSRCFHARIGCAPRDYGRRRGTAVGS
jgi:AraC family transcriptional regulator of arabinose operon